MIALAMLVIGVVMTLAFAAICGASVEMAERGSRSDVLWAGVVLVAGILAAACAIAAIVGAASAHRDAVEPQRVTARRRSLRSLERRPASL